VLNSFLMQFVADINGLRVQASRMQDVTALGAALAGAVGMGVYGTLEELGRLPQEAVGYSPSMDAATVKRNYAGWLDAVERVL
jgi:glycerol kinase